MSDTEATGPSGRLIVGAPRGFGQEPHPMYTTATSHPEERAERPDIIVPCDGVAIFQATYEEVLQDPRSSGYIFKREFRRVGAEYKLKSGSAAGSVFNRLVEILGHLDQRPRYRYWLNGLSHEDRSQVFGIEATHVQRALNGEYSGEHGGHLLDSEFGQLVLDGVLHDVDRSQFLGNELDPDDMQVAYRLGLMVLDGFTDLLDNDCYRPDGERARIGDVLAHLGIDVGAFAPREIE